MSDKSFTITTNRGYDISLKEFPGQGTIKKVVICIHGLTGDKDSSAIAALGNLLGKEKGIEALAFDLPAHGASNAKDVDLTIENCINDLDQVVKYTKQKYSKADLFLFSTSFGSYISLIYISQHDDTFKHAILRAPAINMGEIFFNEFLLRNSVHFNDFVKTGVCIGFERKMTLGKNFTDCMEKYDLFNIFTNQYKTPIYLLQGTADKLIDVGKVRKFVKNNTSNMRLEIIKGAGHQFKEAGAREIILERALNIISGK